MVWSQLRSGPAKCTPNLSGKLGDKAVKPFVLARGRSFCTYSDESKRLTDVKLVHGKDGVSGNHGLLAALKELQAN